MVSAGAEGDRHRRRGRHRSGGGGAPAQRRRRGSRRRYRCGAPEAVEAPGCDILVADLADRRSASGRRRTSDGFDYLVNAAGVLQRQADPRCDGRGLARDPDGQRRVRLLSVPVGRRAPAARRRDRQSVLQLGEARDHRSMSPPTPPRRPRFCRSRARSPMRSRERPVRVNAICPGIVETQMQERFLDGVAPMRGDRRRRTSTPSARKPSRSAAAPAPTNARA